MGKTKEELIEEVSSLQELVDQHNENLKDGFYIKNWEYENYSKQGQENQKLIDENQELKRVNQRLVDSIADLNSGALKDLSQSIVNLTNKI